jgi:hypothetical protein
MAQWREFNASNMPDTCVWCGRKLRQKMTYADFDQGFIDAVRGDKPEMVPRYEKKGDYGDGFFCGLRCGYLFGEQMAKLHHRLRPAST